MKVWIVCVAVFSVLMSINTLANTLSINVHSPDTSAIHIIGNTPPLSMDTPLQLIRKGNHYRISLWLPSTQINDVIRYQFVTEDGSKNLEANQFNQPPELLLEPIQGMRQTKLTQSHTQAVHTFGVPDMINIDEVDNFTPAQLLADLAIAKETIMSIHPGVTRYLDEMQLAQLFSQAKQQLSQPQSVKDAYLIFSKLAATLQCGHTHTGIYNQSALIDQLTLAPANKLPLLFQNIDNRWFITHNLSDKSIIRPGTEIIAINNMAVKTISQQLRSFLSADGNNPAQLKYLTQLLPTTSYQLFDAYFPLLFNPNNQHYKLTLRLPNSSREVIIDVVALTLKEREQALLNLEPTLADNTSSWQYRTLANNTVYLKLGSFATYNMEFDWRAFYAQAFTDIAQTQAQHLIIDIRGNGGGSDETMLQLGEYLSGSLNKQLPFITKRSNIEISDNIKPYLKTWDNELFTQAQPSIPILEKVQTPFDGKVWLLVDGANSSATFMMAKQYQDAGIATIIGSPTGGNVNGINGGGMFFMVLPNTQIEIDIPIYQYLPVDDIVDPQNTQGVIPDVLIKPTVADIITAQDGVLKRVLAHIHSTGTQASIQ
jgi:hypothetical protein